MAHLLDEDNVHLYEHVGTKPTRLGANPRSGSRDITIHKYIRDNTRGNRANEELVGSRKLV